MNKPQIRFKGFEDEHCKTKIFDILSIGNGCDYKHLQPGDIPVFGTGGHMTSVNQHLYDGESVFIGRKGTIDKPMYYNGKFWTVDTLFYTHSFRNSLPLYIYPLFQTINWYLYNAATGVPSLSKETILDIAVTISDNLEEQKQIGTFFKQIDEMIAEAEREVSRLEKMKQASLQKMFPRPGANVPEVRFDGFSEPWTIRSVGSCFAEGSERGGFENLLSVGITRGVYPTEDFIKTVTVKDFSNYKTVHENDIVYNSMRMWQGASGVSSYNGIVSPAYTVLTPHENVWSPFFAYLFKLPWVVKIFEANSQGLTKDTWNLKYPAISIIEFAVPNNIKEQIQIANYFLRLDSLISAKRKKLVKLRNIKQACLDKMFVNTADV